MKPTLRVLLAGPFLMPTSAWGQTVTNLDSGATTTGPQAISTAIGDAAAGDTLELSAGTYTEAVVVDRDLVIRGDGAVTWTASSPATKVIELIANVAFTLDGITISSTNTNRRAISAADGGNTIVIRNSTLDTFTSGNGGALAVEDPVSVTITDTVFQGSGAARAADGGAIHVESDSGANVNLTDVSFDGLRASSEGGAIYTSGADLNCTRCSFTGTEAAASGGAIYATGGSLEVTDSSFCGPESAVGGAIFGNSDSTVTSSRFVEPSGSATSGGAIVAANGTWTVTNNHFLASTGSAAIQVNGTAHLDVVNNLFFDNAGLGIQVSGGTLDSAEYNWFHGNGGISSTGALANTNITTSGDPDLVDWAPGNCSSAQLLPDIDSPLLDAGDPAIDDPDGSRSDIGAFGGPDANDAFHADDDADGFSFVKDCDDDEADSYPGNDEVCDNLDNDCNREVDDDPEDVDTFYPDCDGDGQGDADGGRTQCFEPAPPPCGGDWISANEVGTTAGLDCNDDDPTVNTTADELCLDGDQNCDGDDDDGAIDGNEFFVDGDGDDFGGLVQTSCDVSPPPGTVAVGGDCNDADDTIHPGASDPCGDGADTDCNGGDGDDTTIREWYPDADQDGYGEITDAPTVDCNDFGASGEYTTVDLALDCDDESDLVNPDAVEVCNLVDDDCNGIEDDVVGVSTWFEDQDTDGWGNSDFPVESACPPGPEWVARGEDCDDASEALNPDATEVCNLVDDDCDGEVDAADDNVQGTTEMWVDWDGDGYGACAVGDEDCLALEVCPDEGNENYAPNYDDCNDADASQNPSRQEIPGNALDENCDGEIAGTDDGDIKDEDPGCNCSTGPTPMGALPLVGLLLLALRRRRT